MLLLEHFFANLFFFFSQGAQKRTRAVLYFLLLTDCPTQADAADNPDWSRVRKVLKYCRVQDGKRILNEGHPLIIALGNDKNPVIQLDKTYPPSTFHLLLARNDQAAVDFHRFFRCVIP